VVLNAIYVLAISSLNLFLFAGLPLFLLPQSQWFALLLIPVCLSAPLHWALIHEATHRLLHPAPAVNRGFGRVLSVFFLCPFDVLRVGHLCHHALNGRPSDRPELYDPSRTPRWRAGLVYYFRLGAGLYLGELICTLLALLPRPILRKVARSMAYGGNDDSLRIPDIAEHQLTAPGRLLQIRIDAIVILAMWALAIWAWGWTVWLFLAAVLVRGAFVSLHDNAPHYGMPLGDVHQGHDSRLAPLFRWLVLNANFHGTHHRNPTLPWSELPGRFSQEGRPYRGHYLTSPFRQLRGVIQKSNFGL
jgi:fatty acid desaturase